MTGNLEPVGRYLDKKKAKRCHCVCGYMIRPIIPTYLKTEVLGEENVKDPGGASISAPNHFSRLDVPMIFLLLPDQITEKLVTGAAANYSYHKRGTSSFMSVFFDTYPILCKGGYESTERSKAMDMTGRLLRADVSILVFLEGMRSCNGKIDQPGASVAVLAMQAGVPIVPIAMLGRHEAILVGRSLLKLRSEAYLSIGKSMSGRRGKFLEDYMARVFRATGPVPEQYTPHPVDEDEISPFGGPDDAV